MDFVKKNMLLVIVLTLSVAASAFLVYKAVMATSDMNKYMADVEGLKKEIQAKNAQDIIPSDKNLDAIAEDKGAVAAKRRELEMIFGNPYRKAVERMAAALEISADELRERWKDVYLRETDKGNPRGMIFSMFFNTLGKDKTERAIAAFRKALNNTAEPPLNDTNIKGCVMEALGVPRKMPPMVCKQYLCRTIANLTKEKEQVDPNKPPPFFFGDELESKKNEVRFLTFAKYHGDSLPRPEEVPYIFKHLKLLEDLVRRMKDSGLLGLLDISKKNMMGTTVNDDYVVFTYTVKVRGSLDAVRSFANSLMEAYKNNRVYVIRSMTLEENDEAGKIFNTTGSKAGVGTSGVRAGAPATATATVPEMESSSKVGVVLIGNSDVVTAEIMLDYVIFMGNELVPGGE